MPDTVESPPAYVIEAAVQAARLSTCGSTHRGAVAYVPAEDFIDAVGWNRPPVGGECQHTAACREDCGQVAVHAEAMVLQQCRLTLRVPIFEIVHVRADEGELQTSGPPSCWQCARLMLDDGRVIAVWLYHAVTGWRRYTIIEFYDATMATRGLVNLRITKS